MNSIEFSRSEFRMLLAALVCIPIAVFLVGFYTGLAYETPKELTQSLGIKALDSKSSDPKDLDKDQDTLLNLQKNKSDENLALAPKSTFEKTMDSEFSFNITAEQLVDIELDTSPTQHVETPLPQIAEETTEVVLVKEMPKPLPTGTPLNDLMASKNLFAIQVGNFKDPINANRYRQTLQRSGLDARVLTNEANPKAKTYRVVLGFFVDEEKAKLAAKQHEMKYDHDAYVAVLY